MIRVVITDDHAIVRDGLKQLLSNEAGIQLVGETKDAEELLQLLRRQDCDVLVLDISLPGRSGLDVLKDVRDRFPHIAVLILTVHKEESYAFLALKQGAAGFVTKDQASSELVTAIRKTAAGGKYISAYLSEKLAAHLNVLESGRLPHDSLSEREHEVLRMLASGKTSAEVAQTLHLSVSTIATGLTDFLYQWHRELTASCSVVEPR